MSIRLEITRLAPTEPTREDRPSRRATITLPDDIKRLRIGAQTVFEPHHGPALIPQIVIVINTLFPPEPPPTEQPTCIPD